jgi:PiT family inorganic phosphate transporter
MTSPIDAVATLTAAILLAVVSGANDGSSILALTLPVRLVPPLVALGMLVAGMALVPLVFGTPVVSTLLVGLVEFPPETRPISIAFGAFVAILVSGASARRGLPTSLTLALVGALVGIGVGANEAVRWTAVGVTLALAAAAPFIAGALGLLAGHLLRGLSRAGAQAHVLPPLHVAGYLLQVVAYAANDGQKVLAVLIASGMFLAGGAAFYGMFGVVLAAFGIGTLLGLAPVARKLPRGVVAARAVDSLLAQAASSTAVLLSSAVGTPVSMTQSSAAALVGTDLGDGGHRIRWETAASIAGAWVLTLPAAAAIGYVVGVALNLRQPS